MTPPDTPSGWQRWWPLLLAIGIGLVAWQMSSGWYETLPRQEGLPQPPVNGVTLLRVILLIEAATLALVSVLGWRVAPLPLASRLSGHQDRDDPNDLSSRHANLWLLLIVALAVGLRLYRLDADLWIDEISPINDYMSMSVPQIIGSYVRSNNHLLNTVFVKGMIALFGEHAWSVRLPAVLFGVAGVPVMYWCARLTLSRRAALGAALLLAVSYHHIFFSQNARGYSAYLFLSMLSTRVLIDGLREDRLRSWAVYVGATVLGFASLLNTAFVLAAQGLVALAVIWQVHRRHDDAGPLLRRVLMVFGLAGLLSAQLYAVALPDVYVVISNVYSTQSTGFVLFSWEFVREMVRGVSAGFGSGALIAAIVFLAVAAAGTLAVVRRAWALAWMFILPGILTTAFLIARQLTLSPRFFLLWLPFAMLTAVVALEVSFGWFWRARGARRAAPFATAAVVALSLLSVVSLRRYYAIPKQPYRAAIAYAERERGPDDLVVVVYLAKLGVAYYGAKDQVPLAEHYRFVRTVAALDSALGEWATQHPDGEVWLVTTFERALTMDLPELNDRVQAGWTVQQRFDGTMGDGGVNVWHERPAAGTQP